MTFCQVTSCLEKIAHRRHGNYAAQAALFGHKIKPLRPDPNIFKPIVRTEEEQAELDKDLEALLKNRIKS